MQTASYVHSLWHYALFSDSMIVLAQYGLIVSALAFVFALLRRRSFGVVPWLVVAALVATGLTALAGRVFFDPRPFVVLHVTPLIAHSADNGFPSDHSSVAGFVAAALCFIDVPMAIVASIAMLAIGLARIYCLLHWPVDVIGGWCIGAVPAVLAGYGWRKYAWHLRG